MGIPGLTTYISQRAELFLQPYELRDSYLVIDGNSIIFQLYKVRQKLSCFGGNYDNFAQTISQFFDSLAICNITPLVLMDGGIEKKKFQTSLSQAKYKVKTAFGFNSTTMKRSFFAPLLKKDVFIEVMSKKKVKYIQTLLEADDQIASVARILNCPVLSYDSDFYIYDVMYIPFDTLAPFEVQICKGIVYKECKVCRTSSLMKRFIGLEASHLPLAAILIGNDYLNRFTCKDFYKYLKRSKTIKDYFDGETQDWIEQVFLWLSKHSPQDAISQILATLPLNYREKILNEIEVIIDTYTANDFELLIPLGFSHEFVSEMEMKFKQKPFKFQGDINYLRLEKKFQEEEFENESEEEEDLKKDDDSNDGNENDEVAADVDIGNDLIKITFTQVEKIAPSWFLKEYIEGKYPSYFIDILTIRCYFCPVQIEDFSLTTTFTICTQIMSVIYGILTNGLPDKKPLSYFCRGHDKNIILNQLEARKQMFGRDLPNLSNLKNLPVIDGKKILNSTLGIPDSVLDNDFPSEWRLYAATIIFWMSQQQDRSGMNCHLYSLIFAMLFCVVDKKVGHYRPFKPFHKLDDRNLFIQAILERRRYQRLESVNQNLNVYQAISEVRVEDCLLAVPFFMRHFLVDQDLKAKIKEFNISIVHGFSQFEMCLYHILQLNALLKFPYEQTRISEMLNGTLLYNLCNKFKENCDIETYVSHQLRNSPSLLRLFNVLSKKVESLLKTGALQNNV